MILTSPSKAPTASPLESRFSRNFTYLARLACKDRRGGLTSIGHWPVQNLGTARLPNLDRMRHADFRNNMFLLIS